MNRLRLGLAILLVAAPLPALAADRDLPLDKRVDRVEKELKAVQRKVFPGGSPAFFEPQIAPGAPEAATVGQPASAPLNDLTARVNAIEREVARLTGQTEENQHQLSVMSDQMAKDRQAFDTRLKALEQGGALPGQPAPAIGAATPPPPRVAPPPPRNTTDSAPREDDTASATPSSGDPAEDAYMAGYELWKAKKYPEAEKALKAVVAKYPRHKRASYAQNLLGRAYLDDGNPATAAEAFAANYQTNPRGERAPDSLYYLGQALVQLKKPADACRVYDELDAAYGDKVVGSLKTRVIAARKEAKCK